MPVTATELAVRAFPRDGAILISALWSIPVGRSVLTVRRQSAYTIPITNAMRSMWTLKAAAPATVGRRPAQRFGKREGACLESVRLEPVQLTPFAKRTHSK